jgi:hypothetical protein
MTDRTSDDPGGPADRTRDIRLPPLPDRPPPAMPEDRARLRDEAEAAVAADERLARQRTDELAPPPGTSARERTLAFSSPEMRQRPIERVQVGATPRRWPWVLVALLPVLLVVASGVAWLLLVRGA